MDVSMSGDEHKNPGGPGRRIVRLLVILAAIGGLGVLVVWGFLAGRGEATMEAERERPVKAPLRVSTDGRGQPVVTLDAATRRQSGVDVTKPKSTQYQEQVRAYGTVLDLDKLVTLDNNYVSAVAQLQSAQAKIVASKAAFERAQALSKDNITTVAQLQTAQATFGADKAGVATAEAQVKTLRATALQEWGTVIGKALVESGPLVTASDRAPDFPPPDHTAAWNIHDAAVDRDGSIRRKRLAPSSGFCLGRHANGPEDPRPEFLLCGRCREQSVAGNERPCVPAVRCSHRWN